MDLFLSFFVIAFLTFGQMLHTELVLVVTIISAFLI